MAHGVRIAGTAYGVSGGKTRVGGTEYSISGGKTRVGGTGYDISFVKEPVPVHVTAEEPPSVPGYGLSDVLSYVYISGMGNIKTSTELLLDPGTVVVVCGRSVTAGTKRSLRGVKLNGEEVGIVAYEKYFYNLYEYIVPDDANLIDVDIILSNYYSTSGGVYYTQINEHRRG